MSTAASKFLHDLSRRPYPLASSHHYFWLEHRRGAAAGHAPSPHHHSALLHEVESIRLPAGHQPERRFQVVTELFLDCVQLPHCAGALLSSSSLKRWKHLQHFGSTFARSRHV